MGLLPSGMGILPMRIASNLLRLLGYQNSLAFPRLMHGQDARATEAHLRISLPSVTIGKPNIILNPCFFLNSSFIILHSQA
jgi:hypothetical protein